MEIRVNGKSGLPRRHETKISKMKKNAFGCPVELTLDFIGGKWKTVILWNLNETKTTVRFGVLKKKIPKLNERALSRTLRELESSGLVFRDIYPEVPPHVEYGLTKLGRSLGPLLAAMCK